MPLKILTPAQQLYIMSHDSYHCNITHSPPMPLTLLMPATTPTSCGVGSRGTLGRLQPSCCRLLSPLRWLQDMQAVTRFCQLLTPPRHTGVTWSSVNSRDDPQYLTQQQRQQRRQQRLAYVECPSLTEAQQACIACPPQPHPHERGATQPNRSWQTSGLRV
jgi:hypothetical protein